jgi:O-antigen/teichoic acid export membrane protein
MLQKIAPFVKEKSVKHFSFLILVGSSVAFYIFNILLKYIVSANEYGEFSLFNGFISIALSYALLAGDQLIIRNSEKTANILVINKRDIVLCLLMLAVFTIISSVFFNKLFNTEISILSLILLSIFIGGTIILYAIFRVNSEFVLSQIIRNGWKLLILIGAVVLYLMNININITSISLIFICSIAMVFLLGLLRFNHQNIKFENIKPLDYKLWSGFAVSMLAINILTFSDRFMIDHFIGRAETGQYFFLQNLFLFPLTQVQNYAGFIDLVKFKTNFSQKILNKNIRKNLVLAIIFSFCLFFSVLLFDLATDILKINFRKNLFLILLILTSGILRIVYASLSAAMGAVGDKNKLWITNLLTLILMAGFYFIFSYHSNSVNTLLIYLNILWLIRSLLYYYVIRRG